MITKNDILILLTDLQESGENITPFIKKLYKEQTISLDIIKYINSKRPLDVAAFYEKLRYNYNHKKSDLYINIVKETEDINDILTTLAAYNLQVLLFAKKLDNKEMFYKACRAADVVDVLSTYYKTYDIDKCRVLLSLIKADIKLFEQIK